MDKPIFKFELNVAARDKITGFSGTITARAEYVGGSKSYELSARSKDGDPAKTDWVVEERIELLNTK